MYSIMPSQNNCYIYTCNLALALAVIILLRIISIRNVTTSQHQMIQVRHQKFQLSSERCNNILVCMCRKRPS